MGLFEELIHFMFDGSIAGLPPLVIMAVPFIIGLVLGILARTVLKVALILIVILAIAIFFGFYSTSELQQLAQMYGPDALRYGALLLGVLPLSIGFIIGVIIGFVI